MMTPLKINLSVNQNQVIPVKLSVPESQKADLDVSAPIITGPRDYTKLKNLPTVNGVEIIGDLTSEDLGIDQTFVYEQNSPSEEWHITHNLGRFPSVSVIDSAGSVVVGDVRYLDENKIVCSFSAPFIGTAYLN